MSAIQLVRLSDGTLLIGNVNENQNEIVVNKPYELMIRHSPDGQGQVQLAAFGEMPGICNAVNRMTLTHGQYVYVVPTSKKMEDAYLSASTGIQLAGLATAR